MTGSKSLTFPNMTINTTISKRSNQYYRQICNASSYSNGYARFRGHGWSEPQSQLIMIESLVLASFFLMFILLVCGIYRRKSNNWFVTSLLLIANGALSPLVTYVIGMMQTSPCFFPLFAIWTTCLLLVYSGTSTVSVYSLDDKETWKANSIKGALQAGIAGILVGTYLQPEYKIPLSVLFAMVCYKSDLRALSFFLAATTRSKLFYHRTKLISDHMSREHNITQQVQVDPVNMHGYNYLVEEAGCCGKLIEGRYRLCVDVEEEHVVTTEKVWALGGRFLGPEGDPEGKLKDLCLSFALFRMLLRRFSEYPFSEAVEPKTRSFVFDGLLSKENDHERPFRVVEVELNFLYDNFYTRFPFVYMFEKLSLAVAFIIISSSIWLALKLVNITLYYPKVQNYFLEHYVITTAFVGLIATIETAQIVAYLISDWAKISGICRYMVHTSWHRKYWIEWMLQLLCRIQICARWKNSLGQYSLLQKFGYRSKFGKLIHYISCCWIDKIIDGGKELPSAEVPVPVKREIIAALKFSSGVLKNGILSLQRNQVFEDLQWACSIPSDTQTILVWHVATTLCEIKKTQNLLANATYQMNSMISDQITVAACLSNYCAYLVAFKPELLPDNKSDCEFIFDMVVRDAKTRLNSKMTQEETYGKLMEIGDINAESLVIKGAGLANHLINYVEIPRRWKLLSEFWAEMILYVAPSNNATSHLENLAKGGEFLTQLWALLSHAGILERAPS